MIIICIYSPVCYVPSGLLVIPRCSCVTALPCLALISTLKTVNFELYPHLLVPRSSLVVCRRPDLTVGGAHSPRFVFLFLKVFYFFCLSRGMEVAARHLALAHCKLAWEFGGIAANSTLPSKPTVRGRSMSPSAAHPSPPFAGDRRHCTRLTQACCWFKPASPQVT